MVYQSPPIACQGRFDCDFVEPLNRLAAGFAPIQFEFPFLPAVAIYSVPHASGHVSRFSNSTLYAVNLIPAQLM